MPPYSVRRTLPFSSGLLGVYLGAAAGLLTV